MLTTRNVKLDSCSTMQFSDPMYSFFNFRWLTEQLEITIQMKKMLLVVNIWEQDLFLVENTQNVENCPIKPFLATGTDEAKSNTTVAALWSTGMSVLFVVQFGQISVPFHFLALKDHFENETCFFFVYLQNFFEYINFLADIYQSLQTSMNILSKLLSFNFWESVFQRKRITY